MRRTPSQRVLALAAEQYGAFTRRQALDLGMSPKAIERQRREGRWETVEPGTYLVAGSPRMWEQHVMASILLVGNGAVASFLTAAAIWGMIEEKPHCVHVTVANGKHHARRPDLVIHQSRGMRRSDRRTRRKFRVTSPERTLVDLAGVLSQQKLEAALDAAVGLGLVSIVRLRRYIDERGLGRLRGVGRLKQLLHDREKGVLESELERRFLRRLRRFGLPEPVRQMKVGRRRVDFGYPEQFIAIELDGWGTIGLPPSSARTTKGRTSSWPPGICPSASLGSRWERGLVRSRRFEPHSSSALPTNPLSQRIRPPEGW